MHKVIKEILDEDNVMEPISIFSYYKFYKYKK